jgi:hypothetical protein
MQFLESSHDQDREDRNVRRCDIEASVEAIGDDSNVNCFNSSSTSRGAARVAIHSQVASQGTGVVNVQHADFVMYYLHLHLQLHILHAGCLEGDLIFVFLCLGGIRVSSATAALQHFLVVWVCCIGLYWEYHPGGAAISRALV